MEVKPAGLSYKDPMYDAIEASLEKKHGLPSGGMRAIRTRGERSNADQVSSAGASTVYQIIPETRRLFQRRYGIDAYSSPQAAAEVAALHLRDGMARTGSWEGAVTDYIGGPNPNRHKKVTRAYVSRVTGKPLAVPVGTGGATMLAPNVSLDDIDLLNTDPGDLGSRRPLPRKPADPSTAPSAKKAAHIAALTGGAGIAATVTPMGTPDVSDIKRQDGADYAQALSTSGYGMLDRAAAAIDDNWILNRVIRSMSEDESDADPNFHKEYMRNWQEIEGYAENQAEVDQLREATSHDDLMGIQQRIHQNRVRDKIKDSNGTGWAYDIAAYVTDPVGWVAALGVGKVVQGFGVASRLTSNALEGAASNIAITAAMDATGDDIRPQDYVLDGLLGLGMGAALTPILGHVGPTAELDNLIGNRRAAGDALAERASTNLGPDAAPAAISQEVERLRDSDTRDITQASLAPIPDNERLMSEDPEALLTGNQATLKSVTDRHSLQQVSDPAERSLIAEQTARAEAIDQANPIDKAGIKTILSKVGQESTGLRMLNSDSVVLRAVGRVLLEGTTGAGGRRRTAAMSKAVRERVYMQEVAEYDSLYSLFRKSENKSAIRDFWDGEARKEFDRRVDREVLRREGTAAGPTFDDHAAVVRAADVVERGMDLMRREQVTAGTVGHARLPSTSRGYLPRMLDIRAVKRLSPQQYGKVEGVLEGQFRELNDYTFVNKLGEKETKAYDAAFAKKMAKQYLERAVKKGNGTYDVPFNVHSPEGATIVRDTLEALRIDPEDIEKIMGKYSRGGAAHTKARLTLDLTADIGDGKQLADLFVSDVIGRYRGYARRVSGEVALAQHGIMGKHGLKQLRRAAEATGASVDDLKSYDQIAAEFLNEPFGEHNHAYLDNLRVATSAARLGSMAITQFAETANAIPAVGFQRAFASITSLPAIMKEVRTLSRNGSPKRSILTDIDTLGGRLGLDDYQLTRMFDVKDNDIQIYNQERVGVLSRALRASGHLQAVASGHRILVASQTRGMAEQIVRKAVSYIKSGTDDIALADMGITPEVRAAFAKDLDAIATFDNGKLVDLDLSKATMSDHHMMAFRDAVERGASQIIQRTYIGETGAWAHDGLLKVLAQFRTFSITSIEKQWGRGVNNHGAVKSFAYLMAAMSFAYPLHMARVYSRSIGMSPEKKDKFLQEQTNPIAIGRATLNYASAAGMLGDVLDIGAGFGTSYGLLDPDTVPFSGARGQGRGQLLGGVIAPGLGLVQDIWEGLHGDPKKIAKALPGANLPYTTPLITGLTSE